MGEIKNIINTLTNTDLKNGFLQLDTKHRKMIDEITHHIEKLSLSLTYDLGCNRIFGLTKWYKNNKIKAGDIVIISVRKKKILGIKPGYSKVSKDIYNKAIKAWREYIKYRKAIKDIETPEIKIKSPSLDCAISETIVCHRKGLRKNNISTGIDAIRKDNKKIEIKGTITEEGRTGIGSELNFDYLYWANFDPKEKDKFKLYEFTNKEIRDIIGYSKSKKREINKRNFANFNLSKCLNKKKVEVVNL